MQFLNRVSSLLLAGLAFAVLDRGVAGASYTVTPDGNTISIWGTGRNSDNTGVLGGSAEFNSGNSLYPVDPTWKLVAFPNNYIVSGSKLTFAGNLYSPTRLPGNWNGQAGLGNNSSNRAVTIDGAEYRWITYTDYVNSTASTYGTVVPAEAQTSSYFRASGAASVGTAGAAVCDTESITVNCPNGGIVNGMAIGATPPDYYSYIVRTSFTPSKNGFYTFSTQIAADNFIQVFLGGSITNADTRTPGIGGTGILIAQLNNGTNTGGLFGTITTSTSTSDIWLNAGQNYDLNYVVRDNLAAANTFGSTGLIVAPTAFVWSEVPGPLPLLGIGAFLRQSRRMRRKIAAPKL
ncbi:MAG: hypothetical protein VKI63_02975 [Cyanobium sp.]|nr:hypothetical protein [Cyanobium sp.]